MSNNNTTRYLIIAFMFVTINLSAQLTVNTFMKPLSSGYQNVLDFTKCRMFTVGVGEEMKDAQRVQVCISDTVIAFYFLDGEEMYFMRDGYAYFREGREDAESGYQLLLGPKSFMLISQFEIAFLGISKQH